MSPTQLRNARKRKAAKAKKAKEKEQREREEIRRERGDKFPVKSLDLSKGEGSKKSKPSIDPSQAYISSPKTCPRVLSAASYFASKSLPYPVHVGPLTGWRTSSKLAVRLNHKGKLTIGLFEPSSHKITPASSSPAHHPSINAVVKILESTASKIGVTPYDESTNLGDLKFVFLNVDRKSGTVQLTLIVNLLPTSPLPSSLSSLTSTLPSLTPLISTIYVHYNLSTTKHDNNIFSFEPDTWSLLFGPPCGIEEELEDVKTPYQLKLYFPPTVFRQANVTAFQGIVGRIREVIGELGRKDLRVLELYGGVGTIGLNLLDYVSKLVSSDENPHNLTPFNTSLQNLPKNLRKKASYLQESAEGVVKSGNLSRNSFDLVVVDPPRKGCNPAVLQALCGRGEKDLKTLIYVSCGFDAFKRDAETLEGKGGWKLERGEGRVLFPGADAVETLAVFKR
ncbi:hypothetical protein TrCOL_g12311 [Triparma columacea]|uniref:Uncharacterized protein n=1 Tax=Triparma columacea TaxID=722753 RepID=A0A9W7L4T9_9STRA|nr:hypothetical protein TrCOL_g12311 [Triparma columacea]